MLWFLMSTGQAASVPTNTQEDDAICQFLGRDIAAVLRPKAGVRTLFEGHSLASYLMNKKRWLNTAGLYQILTKHSPGLTGRH